MPTDEEIKEQLLASDNEEEEESEETADEEEEASEEEKEEKEENQESLELLGNKYSLDDEGRNKLAEDVKNIERSYHDTRRELAQMRETLEASEKDEEEVDSSNLPLDVSKLSAEDKEVLEVLQKLITNQTSQEVKKIIDPIIDKQFKSEIESELKQLEEDHGKFDRQVLLDFAYDNNMTDNLVHAYKVWTYDKQMEKGRQLESADKTRKKESSLPSGKKTSGKKIPKYDSKEHGNLTYTELLEKYLE